MSNSSFPSRQKQGNVREVDCSDSNACEKSHDYISFHVPYPVTTSWHSCCVAHKLQVKAFVMIYSSVCSRRLSVACLQGSLRPLGNGVAETHELILELQSLCVCSSCPSLQ
jgi:hypothetical protein